MAYGIRKISMSVRKSIDELINRNRYSVLSVLLQYSALQGIKHDFVDTNVFLII